MQYNDHALNLFCEKYARDLILCCFGNEATNYANSFKFTEYHLEKYQNNIIKNQQLIKDKAILEIGSNTGIWAVLMYLNGATNVTCIEPRKQLADGINQFANLHNLPIVAVNDFHSCIFNLNKTFDTTVMMGIDDLIHDIVTFTNNLKSITDFLILKTKNTDDSVDNCSIKFNVEHNFHHRSGFNINTKVNSLSEMGYQTNINDFVNNPTVGRFIRYHYGKNFYETLFDYLNYEIINYFTYNQTSADNYKIYSVRLN